MEMYHIKNIDVCFFVNDSGNKDEFPMAKEMKREFA